MLKTDQIDTSAPSQKSKWWLLLACMLVFLLLPLLCFHSEGEEEHFFTRSHLFWFHIVWFECIFLALWQAFTGSHIAKLLNQRQQTGGANVAVAYLWYKASMISALLWASSIFIPAKSSWQVLPILVQGVVIVLFALLTFLTPKTKELQMQGMEILPENVPTPPQLANRILEIIPDGCSSEIRNQIRRISEKVRYSLPQVGKISSSQKYLQLVDFVSKLDCSKEEESISSSLRNISNLVIQVSNECKQ